MTTDRRLYDMDLGRRDHTRWLGSSGRYSTQGFAYSDIPNQLLRINSLEGSLAFSGAVLTGVTDVSGAGETVTVTGSPVYTASDADLNGAPSFTASSGNYVTSPNLVRNDVVFVAMVAYRINTDTSYLWRQSDGGSPHRGFFSSSNTMAAGVNSTLVVAGEPLAGRKRVLAGMPGSVMVNGVTIGAAVSITAPGNGIVWGSNSIGSVPMRPAFVMACSSVPSAPLLAALEAKLITDFG